MIWSASLPVVSSVAVQYHAYFGDTCTSQLISPSGGFCVFLQSDFLPSYLNTSLQLFGVTHGMAMGTLTLDWGQITH